MSVCDNTILSVFFGGGSIATVGLCRSRRALLDGLPRSRWRVTAPPGLGNLLWRHHGELPENPSPTSGHPTIDLAGTGRRRSAGDAPGESDG